MIFVKTLLQFSTSADGARACSAIKTVVIGVKLFCLFVSFEDDEVVPSSKYHYWNWIQDTVGDGSEIYLDTGQLLVVTMMMIMTLPLRPIC